MNNVDFSGKDTKFKPLREKIIHQTPSTARIIRGILGLPTNATDAEVATKHAANKARLIRKALGLRADATDAIVATKYAATIARIIRENRGLPMDLRKN